MSKKVWSVYVPEPGPAWIWVIFMLLYSWCCMWFLCMSAQLSTHLVMRSVYYLKKSPVLLKYPYGFFSTHCCHTTVLQPKAEYIRVFRCPCTVRQHLDQTFSWQRMECGDPINWPAWSPELNALNFWLWGHLMALVYLDTISNLKMLQQWVENTHWEIQLKPKIFERVHSSHEKKSWKVVLTCMGTTQSML